MRLLSFLVSVASVSVAADVIHERRYVESGLRRSRRVEPNSVMKFGLALKQQNLEYAYDYLLNVSHPSSQHYGKLWTAEEVKRTFAPSRTSTDTVMKWLRSNGIERVTQDKGWLWFDSSVAHVEELLNTQYFEYEEISKMDAVRVGCDRYHLPEHVSKHTDYITPGVALSAPVEKHGILSSVGKPTRNNGRGVSRSHDLYNEYSNSKKQLEEASNLTNLRQCGGTITPGCIRALYNIPSPTEVAAEYSSGSTNTLGVFENLGTYNQADLDIWFKKYAPHIRNGTHPIAAPVNGAKINPNLLDSNAEANLDIMEMYGLIYPQKITLYQTKARPRQVNANTAEGSAIVYQDLLDALDGSFCTKEEKAHNESCGTYTPARVVSISYGNAEILQPQAYLHRLCNEFMKLSLQGTTFTVSSGDYGVAVFPGETSTGLMNGCIVRGDYNASVRDFEPSHKKVQNGTIFDNQFPASCPYVLSVGATQLGYNETVLDAESAMFLQREYSQAAEISISSAGPRFQDVAIASYFSNHDPGYPHYSLHDGGFNKIGANGGIYNRIGRGIPDVSANGARVAYILDGKIHHAYGTSCSAPIWGSIFTLINEKRSQAGKGPVGFVNPTLYQHPEAFNDIRRGKNPGCFTDGFAAVEGWDPITGLGTPNYEKLLGVFMSLP